MSGSSVRDVFIDPSGTDFLEDRLFDAADARLNRDGTLLPFVRLRNALADAGVSVRTADYLPPAAEGARRSHYWSMGLLDAHASLAGRTDVELRGFILFEPPLVAPAMYRALPELTRRFTEVYLHNVAGDGYSLSGVDRSRLRKLHWPQPYPDAVEPHWSRLERSDRFVVVAGHHRPRHPSPEFYSLRVEAIAELARLGAVDLFGRGWDRWWSADSLWLTYWRHRRRVLAAWRGACADKLETLARYRFSLCLENMPMRGYVSEKIFDCLYAGTVPIYQGGEDEPVAIPTDAWIDARAFDSWTDLWSAIRSMPVATWDRHREAGREFLRGPDHVPYHRALELSIGAAALGGAA